MIRTDYQRDTAGQAMHHLLRFKFVLAGDGLQLLDDFRINIIFVKLPALVSNEAGQPNISDGKAVRRDHRRGFEMASSPGHRAEN